MTNNNMGNNMGTGGDVAGQNQPRKEGMTGSGRGSNLSAEARSKGGKNSPGNFKNDPARAAELGKKGGQSTQSGRNTTNQ